MRVLVISADNFEDSELTEPVQALEQADVDVDIASLDTEIIAGKKGTKVLAKLAVADADAADYDMLFLPGGKAPARLRESETVLALARAFADSGKPIAAICHGPQILISGGLVEGRRMTSYQSVAEELKAAGASCLDQEVVTDGNLITSRQPGDLPVFIAGGGSPVPQLSDVPPRNRTTPVAPFHRRCGRSLDADGERGTVARGVHRRPAGLLGEKRFRPHGPVDPSAHQAVPRRPAPRLAQGPRRPAHRCGARRIRRRLAAGAAPRPVPTARNTSAPRAHRPPRRRCIWIQRRWTSGTGPWPTCAAPRCWRMAASAIMSTARSTATYTLRWSAGRLVLAARRCRRAAASHRGPDRALPRDATTHRPTTDGCRRSGQSATLERLRPLQSKGVCPPCTGRRANLGFLVPTAVLSDDCVIANHRPEDVNGRRPLRPGAFRRCASRANRALPLPERSGPDRSPGCSGRPRGRARIHRADVRITPPAVRAHDRARPMRLCRWVCGLRARRTELRTAMPQAQR